MNFYLDFWCNDTKMLGVVKVKMTAEAFDQLADLPASMQARIYDIQERLVQWPAVSGAKPLRGELKGSFRVRSGDYRVIFTVAGNTLTIWKIGIRRDIYD